MLIARVAFIAAIAVAIAAPAAMGVTTPGPRLALVGQEANRTSLAVFNPRTGEVRDLLSTMSSGVGSGLSEVSTASWSPDGETLALAGSRGRRQPPAIWLVPAAGGPPYPVPGTNGGFLPVFSPDGRSLAFARNQRRMKHRIGRRTHWHFESVAVWIVDMQTGGTRRLTRWRNDLEHYPMSFSPDGSTLLVNRYDQERSGEFEVVALRFDERTSGLLVDEGLFPAYSPDGSMIVMAREAERWTKVGPGEAGSFHDENGAQWRSDENYELFVVDASGANLHRLTRTPTWDEIVASWDPSGMRLAVAGTPTGPRGIRHWAVSEINSDGTCGRLLLAGQRTSYMNPAWQPGSGREAGRIEC